MDKICLNNSMIEEIAEMPSITFSLTNTCNSRCIMCEYWKYKDIKYIPLEFIRDCLFDINLLNTKRVTLTGGEPLLHPEWYIIADIFKQNKIETHLMTNGICLYDESKNIMNYIDEITVSMDSSNSDTYKKLRGIDVFDKVLKGIEFIAKKGKKIRIRTILQKYNFREIFRLIEITKFIGATITFQQMDIYNQFAYGTDDFKTKHGNLKKYILSEDEIYEFENIIEILQNKYKKDFELGIITESPEKLKLISQYFKAVIGKDNFPRFICNLPFYTSVIDYDLSLRPCFFLPSCGSVKNGNLIQCINNDEAKKIRKQILKNERKECAYCIVARFRDMNTGKLNYINDDRNVIGI